jgi:adenylate cyclase
MFYAMGMALQPSRVFDPDLYRTVTQMLVDHRGLVFMSGGGGFLLSCVIMVVFQIERKLGPGVLWHWMTGHYYTPRSEELIFMFLDMRDSTTLGEKLGPLKFSALVRDVFRDLTYPLLDSKAKVSHFIGDEAVIYWSVEDGLRGANCVRLFFKFEDALDKRADYYRTTYGLIPEFKAGVHMGPVVATEVGEIKSEIVFHGDTLNTTARIQGMCNELGSLLVSQELVDRLGELSGFDFHALGPVMLKGKAEPLALCSVETHPC